LKNHCLLICLKKLPVLDNIKLRVRSSEDNIVPEMAFNNDIPLDITKDFTPFGKEPRMFDNFSIAQKEVLSKKGGKITLDVKVEERGIIGPPTAIEVDGKTRVFASGTYGKLMEVKIDPSKNEDPVWTDHGFPPDTAIAEEATPSAVRYGSTISVFVRAKNGHLVERMHNGSQWQWIDRGIPEDDVKLKFDPAAVYMSGISSLNVFVIGTDGHLYKLDLNKPAPWVDLSTLFEDINIDETPFAVESHKGTGIKVFVKGITKSGLSKLYEWNWDSNNKKWKNIDYGSPSDKVNVESKPFAVNYFFVSSPDYDYYAKVFIKGSDDNLWEFDTREKKWVSLKSPVKDRTGVNEHIKVTSSPHGYVKLNEELHDDVYYTLKKIFVKCTDESLWELENSEWKSHQTPENSKLRFSPFVIYNQTAKYLHVFSASNKNSIIERRIGFEIEGSVVSATESTIQLSNKASEINGAYKGMKIKITSGQGVNQIRTIIKYYGLEKTATVSKNWDTTPDTSFYYIVISSMIWNEYNDPFETTLTPTLSWEYWNSKGWAVLKGIDDNTLNLLKDGQITFDLPDNMDKTEITGQESYWIRARIVGGDYGKETYALETDIIPYRESISKISTQKLASTKHTIRSPIVKSLTISYSFEKKLFPERCITYNNLEYLDQSDVCRIENKRFSPFIRMQEKKRSLYLGFDRSFKGGPVRIYFAAEELPFTDKKKPKVDWFYSTKDNWDELSCLDDTEGLIKADILELIGPEDISGKSYFGSHCRWIKGSLIKGEYEQSPLLDGIYPNTTWAVQTETIKDEIIGSGSGEANQTFSLLKFPVLEKEQIRVCEILTQEEKQSLITTSGKDVIHEEKDEQGKVTETWVLWSCVSYFFDSTDKDRHYILDRATGEIIFGDGKRGMIPQAGENNIKAFSYQWGGGKQGNVRIEEIKTLKSAVAGIDSVINPADADGGANSATLDQMLEIGPAMISHRNRAVTASDFEWLAKQGSRKLAKVRCLPNTNNRKTARNERVRETGWVTVVIVPDSKEDKPKPSLELRRKVQKYLEDHCANSLSSKQHVYVTGPFYVDIDVSVDVFVTSIDTAYKVESEVKKKLMAFFHPLTGGTEKEGWDFGRDVSASDIYALLEGIDGVDHVERLKFSYNGTTATTDIDVVEVKKEFLVANGTHTINLELVKGG